MIKLLKLMNERMNGRREKGGTNKGKKERKDGWEEELERQKNERKNRVNEREKSCTEEMIYLRLANIKKVNEITYENMNE